MNSDLVYLVQTDTTVGFLSTNDKKLAHTKRRDENKKILQVVDSFQTLKDNTRVPNKFKKRVRKSIATTFIYPNGDSFRVVDRDNRHFEFIRSFKKMYSTSANITNEKFDRDYALNSADVVVEDFQGFSESTPSKIYKINRTKLQKIR